jgi:hypothetical protein
VTIDRNAMKGTSCMRHQPLTCSPRPTIRHLLPQPRHGTSCETVSVAYFQRLSHPAEILLHLSDCNHKTPSSLSPVLLCSVPTMSICYAILYKSEGTLKARLPFSPNICIHIIPPHSYLPLSPFPLSTIDLSSVLMGSIGQALPISLDAPSVIGFNFHSGRGITNT